MAFYEHVYMARQDLTPAAIEALTEQLKGVLEANGGSLASSENWGTRTLAYRINKSRKATYVMLNIEAPRPRSPSSSGSSASTRTCCAT